MKTSHLIRLCLDLSDCIWIYFLFSKTEIVDTNRSSYGVCDTIVNIAVLLVTYDTYCFLVEDECPQICMLVIGLHSAREPEEIE